MVIFSALGLNSTTRFDAFSNFSTIRITATMDDTAQELNERFAPPNVQLTPEVLIELQSILRLHKITPEELSWKWDAYCMKMGTEETKLDLKTTRDFKKDLQEILERESREKIHKVHDKRGVVATPRAGVSNDVFDIIDGLVGDTPRRPTGSTQKRKSNFETPAAKSSKSHVGSSPNGVPTPDTANTFAERKNAGDVVETLNHQIELPKAGLEPIGAGAEGRVRLKANTELGKFSYKTMAMKVSEASEILDDRIDELIHLVKEHHKLEDDAFGNASSQSPSEIIAVGRICSDSSEGKLNAASLVLETSRRTGAGLRVPLKIEGLASYSLFPGQIVALKGTNASGEFFAATEMLEIPLLPPPASTLAEVESVNARLQTKENASDEDEMEQTTPLTMITSAGPYTTEDNLNFAPFQTLLDAVADTHADVLILTGPFVDIEHPLIRTGEFDLPANYPMSPDKATLTDLFRYHISRPLTQLTQQLPNISIIMIPSVRDAISKHGSWPQARWERKELGLPKQVRCMTNPIVLSINEIVFGISSLDVLDQLRMGEIAGGKARSENLLARLTRRVIEQRHFFPVFPPQMAPSKAASEGADDSFVALGPSLDISYLKLGEWLHVRPDVLITPSVLPPFAKVVESVIAVNPGTLMKKRGAGTYARLTIKPMVVDGATEDGLLGNKLWERCRVDVVRI